MIHKSFALTATKSAAEGLVLARFGTSAGVGTSTIEAKCSSDGLQSEIAAEFARAELILARIEFDRIEAMEGFLCRPRLPETEKLASFAMKVAHALSGYPGRPRPPELRWFPPSARPDACAFIVPGRHATSLSLALSGRCLVESVLHEAKHHEQVAAHRHREATIEAEARSFEEHWGRALMAAYGLSAGDHRRVVVRDLPPPWYDVAAGSVVLHRGGCYVHNPFNSGPSWTWRSAA